MRIKMRKTACRLGTAFLLLIASSPVFAKDTDDDMPPVFMMDEVVVTATRDEQKTDLVPAKVTVITAKISKTARPTMLPICWPRKATWLPAAPWAMVKEHVSIFAAWARQASAARWFWWMASASIRPT